MCVCMYVWMYGCVYIYIYVCITILILIYNMCARHGRYAVAGASTLSQGS